MELAFRKTKTPVSAGVFTPSQPRVNLVPAAALDRAGNAKAKRVAVFAWAGSIVVLGGWWASAAIASGAVADDVTLATANAQTLAVQMSLYAPVTTIATQTQALTDTVASQTASEVDHAEAITRFLAAVGSTMTVESMQISTDNSAGCASVDPFNEVPLIGCITFSGSATNGGSSASEVISSFSSDTWFVNPFIPTVGAATEGVTPLSGSVGLSMEAQTAQAPADTEEGK